MEKVETSDPFRGIPVRKASNDPDNRGSLGPHVLLSTSPYCFCLAAAACQDEAHRRDAWEQVESKDTEIGELQPPSNLLTSRRTARN